MAGPSVACLALLACGVQAAPPGYDNRSAASFHAASFGLKRRGPAALLPASLELYEVSDMSDKEACSQVVDPVEKVEPVWSDPSGSPRADLRAQAGYDHMLLVARFNERLDWLVDLLNKWNWIQNVLVINKGAEVLAPLPRDRVRIRTAHNVGREGESLLHYIIQEYDRLPERVWFLQGDPMTHQPHMNELFDPSVVRLYDPVFQPLTLQFAEYARIPERLLDAEETQLDGRVRQLYVTSSNGGIVFANGVNEDDKLAIAHGVFGFRTILEAMQKEHGVAVRNETIRSICQYLNMSVPDQVDSLIPYTMSAMFYVSSIALRAYPPTFYEDLRRWLIYDDPSGRLALTQAQGGSGVDTCNYLRQAGRRGYLLERLWQFMFTGAQRSSMLRQPPHNIGAAEALSVWPV